MYEDAGVHLGNAYGNQINAVTRNTTIKHIKTLIPKIEEIYGNIEAVADKQRKEVIKNRIVQLQSKVSTKLDALQDELNQIKDFKAKHGKFNSELKSSLNLLVNHVEVQIRKEGERLETLPEFQNPKKVLGLE